MATGKKRKIVIANIAYIKATGNFLINQEDPTNQAWLNKGFILALYSGMGLSTQTPFMMLKGGIVQFYELMVTPEMIAAGIAAGKEGHVVISNLGNNREITFAKPGLKTFDHTMFQLSAALEAKINDAAVTFDAGWAGEPATVAKPTAANMPPAPVITNDDDDNDIENAVPGEEVKSPEQLQAEAAAALANNVTA